MALADDVERINLAYSTNPTVLQQEQGDHDDFPTPPLSPLTFHDKHLDLSLTLRHVKPLSSLVADLSDIATELVQRITDLDAPLPEDGYGAYCIEPTDEPDMQDAASVAAHYVSNVSRPCCNLASTLAFHPTSPRWSSVLCWSRPASRRRSPWDIGFAVDGYSLQIRHTEGMPYELNFPLDVLDGLDDKTENELLQLTFAAPYLITGQIYAVTEEAKELVKSLLNPSLSQFSWITPRTVGQGQCSVWASETAGLDADALPSVKDAVHKSQITTKVQPPLKTVSRVIPPPRVGTRRGRGHDARPEPRQFLQHAWVESVLENTTFILFHCGRYDRIGIRHRASQTLYLSDLIDVNNCKDPAYGKLQVGLYLAALQDAKGRLAGTKVFSATAEVKVAGKKRHRSDDEVQSTRPHKQTRSKVQKNTERQVDESDEFFMQELKNRDLALVCLQYGIYNSPVPASFLRCSPSITWGEIPAPFKNPKPKAGYNLTEYFSITLGEQTDKGAIGVIHRGTLSLRTSSGTTITREVVAKLAFPPEHQERLQNEVDAYVSLSHAKDVKGILPVYGLFRDMEGGPLMLILPYGGVSLCRRAEDNLRAGFPYEVTVSESERKAFFEALQSIHDAGFRHGDIREENMLVNGTDVYFIDFDRSRDVVSYEVKEDEMMLLGSIVGALGPA